MPPVRANGKQQQKPPRWIVPAALVLVVTLASFNSVDTTVDSMAQQRRPKSTLPQDHRLHHQSKGSVVERLSDDATDDGTAEDDTDDTITRGGPDPHGAPPAVPQIAWLLSFPNSGTTYTLKYVQSATHTTTATNYGATEQVGYATSIAVDPATPSGPYFRYPERPRPIYSILTKTHCEANAVPALTTRKNGTAAFVKACCSGTRNIDGRAFPTTYPLAAVTHTVHLIRNPFDNAVARMRYKVKHWAKQNATADSDGAESETDARVLARRCATTPAGFRHWCRYMDEKEKRGLRKYFADDFWEEHLADLPCALEYYRYAQWHNLAGAAVAAVAAASTTTTSTAASTASSTDAAATTSMVLYYENYTTNHAETTARLLRFLRLDGDRHERSTGGAGATTAAAATALAFEAGHSYPDFMDAEHVDRVRRLARAVATDATWALLRHYFE